MRTDERYIASDCFETYPFPLVIQSLEEIGECYHNHRRDIMTARGEGLTAAYNRFHAQSETSKDIADLRRLQVELDYAVANVYGWTDLNLSHAFYATRQGIRYTISEAARLEVLDRLLALNHERYAQEQALAEAEPRPKRKKAKVAAAHPELF